MSSVNDIQHQAIDDLIKSSHVDGYNKLEWIPYSQINDVESNQTDNLYYAIQKRTYDGRVNDVKIALLLVGSSEECTTTFVSEFARIYSLPTHKYGNNVNQFRRYSAWLMGRNEYQV